METKSIICKIKERLLQLDKRTYYMIGIISVFVLCSGIIMHINGQKRVEDSVIGADKGSLEDIVACSFKNKIVVDGEYFNRISSSVLQVLSQRNVNLEVKSSSHSIIVKGKDIDNYSNEISTSIDICKSDRLKGYIISMKDAKKYPGKVTLKINDKKYKGKYIYVFSKVNKRYVLLSSNYANEIQLSADEKYLVTDSLLYKIKINHNIIAIVVGIILFFIVLYILINKRYWFW